MYLKQKKRKKKRKSDDMDMKLITLKEEKSLNKVGEEKETLIAVFEAKSMNAPLTFLFSVKGDSDFVMGAVNNMGASMVGHIIDVQFGKTKQTKIGES
jgi:hypothetical protein